MKSIEQHLCSWEFSDRWPRQNQGIKYLDGQITLRRKRVKQNRTRVSKIPRKFNADYARVLRHRIKAKTVQMRGELTLLSGASLNVTGNCNGVTEFCNGQQNKQGLNYVAFKEKLAGPTGIEPATYGLRVRRSSLTEPRARMASLLKKVSLDNIELTVCCCSVLQ